MIPEETNTNPQNSPWNHQDPRRLWISVLQEMHWAHRYDLPFESLASPPVAPTRLLVKITAPFERIFEFGRLVCAPLSVDDILLELTPLALASSTSVLSSKTPMLHPTSNTRQLLHPPSSNHHARGY